MKHKNNPANAGRGHIPVTAQRQTVQANKLVRNR